MFVDAEVNTKGGTDICTNDVITTFKIQEPYALALSNSGLVVWDLSSFPTPVTENTLIQSDAI